MRGRKPWLMTDERIGDVLLPALRRLPPGSGVVFRHRATPPADRHALFLAVRRIATARRLRLTSVGGIAGGAEHGGRRPVTASAHGRAQAIRAARAGARLVFVSPVFPTSSHPGAAALGPARAAAIGRGLYVEVIALGGMDERRWRAIRHLGFDGWAAIDALTARTRGRKRRDQKRNAVPT